jgi:RNA-directed DNA polymerase
MSSDLGLPPNFLWNFAKGASHAYRTYYVKKKDGNVRTIHHPSKQLKGMQRWLVDAIISKWPVHPAATAYRTGKSIFDNASAHAASKYLLRMDCQDFFPSITELDVKHFIADKPTLFPGWDAYDIEAFCRLICKEQRLVIGAPSSPSLSNALCFDMDSELAGLAGKYSVVYTRYADDLFFSSAVPNVLADVQVAVETIVASQKIPGELKINAAKTRHSSKRCTRRVTGIVLGSDGKPHVGRRLKRRIRSMVHNYDELDGRTRQSLAGLIAYAIGFEPSFLNSLIQKYGFPTIHKARYPHR